jgi:hypothetical protein
MIKHLRNVNMLRDYLMSMGPNFESQQCIEICGFNEKTQPLIHVGSLPMMFLLPSFP